MSFDGEIQKVGRYIKGWLMSEPINDMFMKKPRVLKTFFFSGKQTEIDVFFSMNCLNVLLINSIQQREPEK